MQGFQEFEREKEGDIVIVGNIGKQVLECVKGELWNEWKEINWYGRAPIERTAPPPGRYCNPEWPRFCEHLLGDRCMRYDKILITDSRMSFEFHRQQKCERCRKEKPGAQTVLEGM